MTAGRLLKGQLLIEAIVAFSITMIALVALLELSNRSSATSGLANRTAQATAYADEGMNWVDQQESIMSWSDFNDVVAGGSYCLKSLDFDSGGSCLSGNEIAGTIFTRNLVFTTGVRNSKNYIDANVTITWPEGSRTVTVKRQNEYFNN
jgi:hypothetical protein